MSLVAAFEKHLCSTFTYFTWTWNHAIILWIMVKPCMWSTQIPNCERVSFVRQQFSLTLEKVVQVVECKDLSDIGRTEATLALPRLVFCKVIVSSSVTHQWQWCKITWNHAEILVTIALFIIPFMDSIFLSANDVGYEQKLFVWN